MKYLILLVILIASVGVTYKITFDMTQEVVGALYIQGIINDHIVHKKLVEAIASDDSETVTRISNGMVSYNMEILEILVSSLESGGYYRFTKNEVIKGREYLNEIANKTR